MNTQKVRWPGLEQYERCREDFLYFIQTLYIRTPQGDHIQFKPYQFQVDFIKNRLLSNNNLVVKQSRQMGCTRIYIMYAFWLACFKRETVSFVTLNFDQAKSYKYIFEDISLFTHGDRNLFSGLVSFDACSSSLEGAPDAQTRIMDNYAFFSNPPKISPWSRNIISSCRNKGCPKFDDMYNNAIRGQTNYIPVHLPWYLHPDRDESWKTRTEGYLGEEIFSQEYE